MEWIKEYILTIISAGIICGICIALTDKNKTSGTVVKMVCGVFLTLVMIAPAVKIRLDDLDMYIESIKIDGELAAQEGSAAAREEMSAVIKQDLETYILDKAASMNLDLQVCVVMDDNCDPPVPEQTILSGPVSAYHKKVLSQFIDKNIGIPEAQQQWN